MVALLVALAAAATLLGGCRRVVTPAPVAPPEPTPFSLVGTWTITEEDLVQTLTFTDTRWVHHFARTGSDGAVEESWAESGAWHEVGDVVTRTWVDYEQDPPTVRSVDKLFARGADDNELAIHPWDLGDPADELVTYSRVDTPLPDSLIGTWRMGSGATVEFAADAFTYRGPLPLDVEGGDEDADVSITASWTQGPDHTVVLSNVTSSSPLISAAATLRLAYAPTNRRDQIVVSPFWNEQQLQTDGSWTDHPVHRYGRYDATLTVLPPPPALIGTWRMTDADGYLQTLTFTASRWIHHFALIGSDGAAEESWAESGTWSVEGYTVTRTWIDYEQDPPAPRNVDKQFERGADDDELVVHPWDFGDPADEFVTFTRVADPVPEPPLGTWTHVLDSGVALSFSFEAAGGFTYTVEGEDATIFSFDATWTAGEGYTVHLSEVVFTGPNPEFDDVTGALLRLAYAPGQSRDAILISSYWAEQQRQDDGTWVDHPIHRYGGYWQLYDRQ